MDTLASDLPSLSTGAQPPVSLPVQDLTARLKAVIDDARRHADLEPEAVIGLMTDALDYLDRARDETVGKARSRRISWGRIARKARMEPQSAWAHWRDQDISRDDFGR
jgi:hypothetical protein